MLYFDILALWFLESVFNVYYTYLHYTILYMCRFLFIYNSDTMEINLAHCVFLHLLRLVSFKMIQQLGDMISLASLSIKTGTREKK